MQLFLRVNALGAESYEQIRRKLIDVDDFVGATGALMRTRTGEISVEARELRLISKALSPLPVVKERRLDDGSIVEYGEFSDRETRYRQRYADLAVNKSVRDIFVKRARTIKALRDFLDAEGMLEVETPVLQPLYGGAAARPFTTHHNQLHQELYLRVSFELYLKRLLVGGFDAVYEIGRDFRNEGVSYKHNTEFTMLEFYKAYIDYNGVMDITERMFALHRRASNGFGRDHVSRNAHRSGAALEARQHPRGGAGAARFRLHGLPDEPIALCLPGGARHGRWAGPGRYLGPA